MRKIKQSIKCGDVVQMSEDFMKGLKSNGSAEHVEEFGDCLGIVEGLTHYGNGTFGPELEVRWYPSKLHYAYHPIHLKLIAKGIK